MLTDSININNNPPINLQNVAEKPKEIKNLSIAGIMVGFMLAALVFITSLAWNSAAQSAIQRQNTRTIKASFMYSIILTLISTIGVYLIIISGIRIVDVNDIASEIKAANKSHGTVVAGGKLNRIGGFNQKIDKYLWLKKLWPLILLLSSIGLTILIFYLIPDNDDDDDEEKKENYK